MKGIVIETTNLREGGSVHEMADGKKYHFKPNSLGHHICTVTDKKHAMRFLKIDGFQPYMGDEEDDAEGGGGEVVVTDLDDDADLIDDDADAGGASEADGEGEGGDTTDQPSQAAVPDLAALSADELAKLHVEVVGRPPHPNAKRETIEAKVKEAIEGQAPAA